MEIRLLTPEDAEEYQTLRLRMLKEHPGAFGASYEETQERGLEEVAERLESTEDRFVLGAFDGDSLIGTVGFYRQEGSKVRHKGTIWGMYTLPRGRGRGVGKALLEKMLAEIRGLPGLEQVQLCVAEGNLPAFNLYTAFGFEAYGWEKNALKLPDRYVDEVQMALKLTSE